MNISIYGHASVHVLTYTAYGVYREALLPSGALLIHTALPSLQSQLAPLVPDDSIVSNLDIKQKHYDNYRREYKMLHCYQDNTKRNYYAISSHLGYRDGNASHNIYNFPPQRTDSPADLIIWDEGLGDLVLPEGCRTALWASNKALPKKDQFDKIADKCFLFIDVDTLRSAGAMISRQISWERSASELVWQLQNNPTVSYLLRAPHILIPFAEDGAVYIKNAEMQIEAFLILTHGGAEGALRERIPGQFDGAFATMTAAAGLMFSSFIDGNVNLRLLRVVLEVGEAYIMSGYTVDVESDSVSISGKTEGKEWEAFLIPLTSDEKHTQVYVKDDWTIADSVSDKQLYDVALEYVKKGSEVIDGLPQLSFGALTTVDRWEIESYQNIRNLIINYASGENIRPLSIAVFGTPGSGKSFGVTQIAQNVLADKAKVLEFNVSQFTGLADLDIAFQKVRDTILGGKLPLVFFDEFDSDRDGHSLGWVKSFLMPMQDGKFQNKSSEYPIGKCILVFAGGTASSFEQFSSPMQNCINEGDRESYKLFRTIKGPDFISRLRGTITVLGPNPQSDNDKNYILRRALLLRSLCERRLKFKLGSAPVSTDIIRAMLLVPMYKHGARSMEAILDMSRIEGNIWEPVSLPAFSQLSIHVDAKSFIELVLQDKCPP
jgi:hypothetical protein